MTSRIDPDARGAPPERSGQRKPPERGAAELSEALEDYLEIILTLGSQQKVVRVRDIARAKSVRMPTVTWALKRLAERGLVDYAAREYVELTSDGSAIARRVAGRHRFLSRFLQKTLGVPGAVAREDACGLEHHLSAQSLERLASFVEYIETCPEVGRGFLQRFRDCFRRSDHPSASCTREDCPRRGQKPARPRRGAHELESIADLEEGAQGEIARIQAPERVRVRLMRRGVVPGVAIDVVRRGSRRRPTGVRVQGEQFELAPVEARTIFIDTRKQEETADDTP